MKIQRRHWLAILGLLLLLLLATSLDVRAADATWYAQYYNNTTLSGTPVLTRQEAAIDYDWGERDPAGPGVKVDEFSVRWTRSINFPNSTNYRFTATMDDGMRVFVDDQLVLDAWTTGVERTVTADHYLTAGDHVVRVEYFDAILGAVARFSWSESPDQVIPPIQEPFNFWYGAYFNNQDLVGVPAVVRNDNAIDFFWGFNAPAPGINSDHFSVRWTRQLNVEPGRYRFTVMSDDGVRLWVNNQLIIDRWQQQNVTSYSAEIDLAGSNIPVRLEYFEQTGLAEARLSWVKVTDTTPPGTGGQPPATVASLRMNVRQGPSTTYAVIDTLDQGTTVLLAGLRNAEATWVMIVLPDGTQGWAYAPLLETDYPINQLEVWDDDDDGEPAGAVGTIINASYLNVRSGPGVSFDVITVISGGAQVELIGRNANNSWFKVTLAGGTVGWVSSNYVATTYPVNTLPVLTN